MSYEKQNFVDGQTLTAAQLNHMEAGITATATGVKGDKGDPGPQGSKGDKGDPGDGISENAKELLLSLFENAAYKTSDAQDTLNALRVEWGRSAQEIPVQSVSLSAATLTLNEGESKTLTATVLPANATSRVVARCTCRVCYGGKRRGDGHQSGQLHRDCHRRRQERKLYGDGGRGGDGAAALRPAQ